MTANFLIISLIPYIVKKVPEKAQAVTVKTVGAKITNGLKVSSSFIPTTEVGRTVHTYRSQQSVTMLERQKDVKKETDVHFENYYKSAGETNGRSRVKI